MVKPDINYVPLVRTFSPKDIAFIHSVLGDSGIRYFIRGEGLTHLRPHADPAILMVDEEAVEDAKELLKDLPLSLPVIELNGACISELSSGEHFVIRSMDQALAESILQLARSAGHAPLVTTFSGSRDLLYAEAPRNPGVEWYITDRIQHGDKRLQLVKDVARSLSDQVLCFSIIGALEPLGEIKRSVEESIGHKVVLNLFENRYSPGWYWLTIQDARATKEQALRRLLRQCEREDAELVVFGDGPQDVGMFSVAERGIAVANADDDVKQYASATIGSNMEDSVPVFLRSDWSPRS